jgi:hypothetical protein
VSDSTGPDPLTAAERRAVLRENLEREKSRRRTAEAKLTEVRQVAVDFRSHHVALNPQAEALWHDVMQVIDRDKPGSEEGNGGDEWGEQP